MCSRSCNVNPRSAVQAQDQMSKTKTRGLRSRLEIQDQELRSITKTNTKGLKTTITILKRSTRWRRILDMLEVEILPQGLHLFLRYNIKYTNCYCLYHVKSILSSKWNVSHFISEKQCIRFAGAKAVSHSTVPLLRLSNIMPGYYYLFSYLFY